jgi:L-fuculokinase
LPEVRVKGYLGIDIGTTNTKALLLAEDGNVVWNASSSTPTVRSSGLEWFDLSRMNRIIDEFCEAAQRRCTLDGVAFSSVGESVVPVKNGRAMSNAVMWHEKTATHDEREGEVLRAYACQECTGLAYDAYYAVSKILWMRRRDARLQSAQHWLPLTSYQVYRKTGCTAWDNSQACRSYLYDIHRRAWRADLLDALNLPAPGALLPMGSDCGEAGGIRYGLGGHDHITGLHALYELYERSPFFYGSMGTSGALALFSRPSREQLAKSGIYETADGYVVAGFLSDEYITVRSFRYFGELLARLMRLGGRAADKAAFNALNSTIAARIAEGLGALFANGGDLIVGKHKDNGINIFSLDRATSHDELMRDAYFYLSTVSGMLYRALETLGSHNDQTLPCFWGGGIARNELFMRCMATALGRPLTLLNVSEIGALGAALIVARICGDISAVQSAKELIVSPQTLEPEPAWADAFSTARMRYEALALQEGGALS